MCFGIKKLTRAVKVLAARIGDQTSAIENQTETLVDIRLLLRRALGPPSPSGLLRARLVREEGTMAGKKLVYDFDLPQGPADMDPEEVIRGEVRLAYDGAAQDPISTTIGQTVLENVKIDPGVEVSGSFVFIDDNNNPSANPINLTPFTTSDTIPPPDPVGDFGARLKGEEA